MVAAEEEIRKRIEENQKNNSKNKIKKEAL